MDTSKTSGDPDSGGVGALSNEMSAHLLHLQLVFDRIEDVVYVVRMDTDGYRFVAVNAAFFKATALAPDSVEGKLVVEVIPPPSYELVEGHYREAIRTGRPVHWKEVSEYPAGIKYGEVMVAPVFDALGQCTHLIGTVHDATPHHNARDALEHVASTDELTTLPNRSYFRRQLTHEIERAKLVGQTVALLYIDVDDFKVVNDSLGHDVGDAFLWIFARRLRDNARSRDFVARLGGDEFGIITVLDDFPSEAAACAHRLSESLREPFTIQGHELLVGASVGIASFPNDAKNEAELIRLADTAMYQAKAAGRNRHLFYKDEMNVWAQERRDIEQALKVAIPREEFRLHYQPQVDLKTLRIVGVEALLRWNRPGTGLVFPATFIPRLEETGLIVKVGDWVISEVCRQLARWRDRGLEVLPVAINVSARRFVPDTHATTSRESQEGQLARQIARCLGQYLVPAELIELEVTETCLMIDSDFARSSLSAVRALGVKIHIDDFGTGYSSLAQLKRLPLDSIKIDQAFIKGLPDGPEDAAVVRAVIALAHNLGLTVVAEGVETAAQHEFLASAGCNSAQGFWYARPLQPDEIPALLQLGTLAN